MVENITPIIAFFTLISNLVFLVFVIYLFINTNFKKLVYDFVNKYILELVFVFSFFSLVGSLLYSNIVGFPPCELCWIQRIFIYPQALISFMAMLKKDKGIIYYLFPLTLLGVIVSFYHSLTNWGWGGNLLDCTAVGGECSKVYVLEYGYITIPFMAFSSFLYLISVKVIYYFSQNDRI